jgi:hypothetical protein
MSRIKMVVLLQSYCYAKEKENIMISIMSINRQIFRKVHYAMTAMTE